MTCSREGYETVPIIPEAGPVESPGKRLEVGIVKAPESLTITRSFEID